MYKLSKKLYYIGVVITFLSLAGLSESFTGHGSTLGAIIWLVVGLVMILQGYIK